jgi:hypothetical protein
MTVKEWPAGRTLGGLSCRRKIDGVTGRRPTVVVAVSVPQDNGVGKRSQAGPAPNIIGGRPWRSGRALEALADYLLSCMPGCRTALRILGGAGEYDLVCSVTGKDAVHLFHGTERTSC